MAMMFRLQSHPTIILLMIVSCSAIPLAQHDHGLDLIPINISVPPVVLVPVSLHMLCCFTSFLVLMTESLFGLMSVNSQPFFSSVDGSTLFLLLLTC